jgi:hypothetical protein
MPENHHRMISTLTSSKLDKAVKFEGENPWEVIWQHVRHIASCWTEIHFEQRAVKERIPGSIGPPLSCEIAQIVPKRCSLKSSSPMPDKSARKTEYLLVLGVDLLAPTTQPSLEFLSSQPQLNFSSLSPTLTPIFFGSSIDFGYISFARPPLHTNHERPQSQIIESLPEI